MALTSFSMWAARSGIPQNLLDLRIMERGSIDLNKHAFDLNEVPLADLNLGIYDVSASTSLSPLLLPPQSLSTPPLSSSSFMGNDPFPVRKGGWLELFRNMFGNANLVGCFPCAPDVSGLSSSSSSGGTGEFRWWQGGKRSRTGEQNPHWASLQQHKRARTDGHHEQPHCNFSSNGPFFPMPSQKNRNKAAVSTYASIIDTELWQGSQSYLEGTYGKTCPLLEQDTLLKGNYPQGAEPDKKNKEDNIRTRKSIINPSRSLPIAGTFNCIPGQDLFNPDPQLTTTTPSLSSEGFGVEQICRRKKGDSLRENAIATNCNELIEYPTKESAASSTKVIPSPDWLPSNWITELKTRKTGSTAGTTDKYYKDPSTGHRFRSRNEVMNYLRTGSVSRCKPKVNYLKGTSFRRPSFSTEGLSAMDVQSCHIHSSVANSSEKKNLNLPPNLSRSIVASGMSRFVPQAAVCASQMPLESSTEGYIASCGLPLKKVVVKQEQEDILTSENLHKVPDVFASPHGFTPHSFTSGVQYEAREDLNMLGLFSTQTFQEPVRRPQSYWKRGMPVDASTELPSKYKCFNMKEWDTQELPQNTWTAYLNTPLRNSEVQRLYDANVVIARSPLSEAAHKAYQSSKDLVVPLHTAAAMELVSSRDSNPASLPGSHLHAYSRSNHVYQRNYQSRKAPPKKLVNRTAKQNRELLVALGKSLCQQYLASASKTVQGESR